MSPCELLGQIAYRHLRGTPTAVDESDEASIAAGKAHDDARVVSRLLETNAHALHDRTGAHWLAPITWPDRVPGLITWSGQQTLSKIIAKLQRAVRDHGEGHDPLTLVVPMQGATGLDAQSCPDPIDIGFNPRVHDDMDIAMRPALELLAILGAELVPLVSFGVRDCGFVHGGKIYRFTVEARAGADAYYHRWGEMRAYDHR